MRCYLLECEDARRLCSRAKSPYPVEPGDRVELDGGSVLFKNAYGKYSLMADAADGSDLPEGMEVDRVEKGGKLHVKMKKSVRGARRRSQEKER